MMDTLQENWKAQMPTANDERCLIQHQAQDTLALANSLSFAYLII